jgi:hypothetical protein
VTSAKCSKVGKKGKTALAALELDGNREVSFIAVEEIEYLDSLQKSFNSAP